MEFNAEIKKVTDPIYQKVSGIIPEIEWSTHAPYIYKINKLKKEKNAVILAHNYQTPEIYHGISDFSADSLALAVEAAKTKADIIIMCGVHFMAETASILSGDSQRVILPNLAAGCSMADMAQIDDVMDCWDDLSDQLGTNSITPITYMNSTAAIKAICGRNDGIVCTSSNAAATYKWALEKDKKILFLPDQHLGRNTGLKMGIDLSEMIVWNPFKPLGGHTPKEIDDAKVILWQGHCSVHTRFTVEQIRLAREANPDVNVIVHPECTMEVVEAADSNGSTEFIKKTIEDASPGTKWAVGTEISMVNRIARENSDKTVFCLDSVVCPCSTMYRIHPAYLSWVLDGLIQGVVVNEIDVDEETSSYAKIALDRMLSIV